MNPVVTSISHTGAAVENRSDSLPRDPVIHIVFHSLWAATVDARIPQLPGGSGRVGREIASLRRGAVRRARPQPPQHRPQLCTTVWEAGHQGLA